MSIDAPTGGSIQMERFEIIKREYEEHNCLNDHDDHRWLIEKLAVAQAEVKRLREGVEHEIIPGNELEEIRAATLGIDFKEDDPLCQFAAWCNKMYHEIKFFQIDIRNLKTENERLREETKRLQSVDHPGLRPAATDRICGEHRPSWNRKG